MFIDFENLVYGVENNEQNDESEALDVDVQRLVRFARDEGRLVLARAYADWRNASVRQHQRDLYVQGIETVNVFGRRHDNEVKNSVDVALAVDGVRSLFEREYDTFILISGDRDFLPLLRVVREHGHRIIGISVRESASRDLPNLCDRFVYYRDLWRTWAPETERSEEQPIKDLDSFKTQLAALLREEVGPGGVLGATLKPMIRNRIDPGFDEMRFGFSKFSRMLEAMPEVARFRYTSDAHGGDIRVYPVDAQPAEDAAASEVRERSVTPSPRPSAVISRPARGWEPTPEAFLTRARARLARTGLHLDLGRRSDIVAAIYAELPTEEGYVSQATVLDRLEGKRSPAGMELEHSVLRRYLWALYQSWVFDIDPPDRSKDHLERGLRLKEEYKQLDSLRLRLEQSLVYKVYELLPDAIEEKYARISSLLEVDQARAKELLERVESYQQAQAQRGR